MEQKHEEATIDENLFTKEKEIIDYYIKYKEVKRMIFDSIV